VRDVILTSQDSLFFRCGFAIIIFFCF